MSEIDLYFTDETAFKLTPNVPYGWQPIGEQLSIRSSNDKVANVFGLLSYQGILKTFITKQNIDSDFIIECVDEIADKIVIPTVLVFDNAPWHTAKKIDQRIKQWQEKGLYLFYLPVYSPHLNPIETLWRKIKLEWLKSKDYESSKSLKDALLYIIKNYDAEFCINFSKNL